jgi:transcriptional regulator of acetoin/glycerol metabolism
MNEPKPAVPWSPEAEALEDMKKRSIVNALETSYGNVTVAAEKLGVGRSTLNKMLVRFGLVERARQLRLDGGGRSTGRPRRA